ncbi:MAG TPA: hypothetical protein VNQ79_15990 [Blastocatellia bacterium]|nr:hypothetical protein [Blastocatellia bacterium]
MKKLFSTIIVAGIAFALTAPAFAQTAGTKTPGIRHRQRNQQHRIRQGVRSGELTAGETRRLEKEQKDIQQDKKAAKSDGTVTAQERREIHQEQNQASRHIYRAKHNRRDRRN